MNVPLRLGLVGLGKIARDQHLPAIARDPGLELAAIATLDGEAAGVPVHRSVEAMLAAHPEIDAVVMCQPPASRFAASRAALLAGKHVFLEKPPGVTPDEVRGLQSLARDRGLTLFAGWHSRWSGSVAALKAWCADRALGRVRIDWKEDVRVWHSGQDWIWQEGGFGVFDPGINALSILTEVVARPVRLLSASLEVPGNCDTPIAARLDLELEDGAPVEVEFDWRQTGSQVWRIAIEAGDERRVFDQGSDDGEPEGAGEAVLASEYPRMYRHFAELVAAGRSEVDCAPLEIVAEALSRGHVTRVEPFDRKAVRP